MGGTSDLGVWDSGDPSRNRCAVVCGSGVGTLNGVFGEVQNRVAFGASSDPGAGPP